MVATGALALWAAALLAGPAAAATRPGCGREGLRGPVQSVSYLGAHSYDPGTGGAEADVVLGRKESPVVTVFALAASLATTSLKPCRFPMPSDRERDGLLGAVHTVACIRDHEPMDWACPFFETVYTHDGWLQERIWADYDGSAAGRGAHRRNPTTGNVEVDDLDKAGEPTGIKEVITCNEASRTLTEETFTAQGGAGRRVLTFDAQGNLTVEETLYGDGSLNNRLLYRYDENGRRSETVWDDPHSVAPAKTTFKYDAQGTLLEQDWYNKAGKLYSKEFFSYKLDAHGNWVERSSRLCEPSRSKPGEVGCGAPTIERRRITYYDDGR